ncbi:MAG: ABC transporter ATP-binding protein [Chloroflexota bacterium]
MSLNVQNLAHTYVSSELSDNKVLSNITFSLNSGDQLLLRGISGSGKTTLINILAGLLTPTAGKITLANQSIYNLSEGERDDWRRQHIGYVFQTHHLLPLLNAWENVAMPLSFRGIARRETKAQAMSLLKMVGLQDFANNRPDQLSTGQRQRVAIARALVNQPALILADEPTASLDQDAAGQVLDLLQKSCREQGAILIVASHDPALNDRFNQKANLVYGQFQIEKEPITA